VIDQQRTQALFRRLDQLLAKPRARLLPERVHQFRTTARRLESVLDVMYPDPDARVRKLRRGLRRLRRRAGQVRDVDVQMIALRKLNIGRETERKTRLMSALAEMRVQCEQELASVLHRGKVRRLRRRLRRTAAEIAAFSASGSGGEGAAPGWLEFDAAGTALRHFAGLVRRTNTLTEQNLHAFRTACKRIRYVAEMGGGGDAQAKHVVELLKHIQDAAGDWHDWLTLSTTAERVFTHDGALVAALHNITQAKFHEARTVAMAARRELMAMYRALLARRKPPPRMPPSAAAVRTASAA
jgi:CHAD domain-containing protein